MGEAEGTGGSMTELPPIVIGRISAEVLFEDPHWPDPERLYGLIGRGLQAAVPVVDARCPAGPAIVSIVLADDATVRRLNAGYRGKDAPTNVLSFPGDGAPDPEGVVPLGDVILGREQVEREAHEQPIPLDHHVVHLVVHGVLHLVGFDHETDADAMEMETLETRILHSLDIPDPYGRDAAGDQDNGGRHPQ